MTRAVSLAMYDPGEGAVDRLWDDLRGRLIATGFDELPVTPGGSEDIEATWLDSNLLLAQTCGYPLRRLLDGRVRYVGTPIYAVEGTDGPNYRSAIVVRADDRAGRLEDLRGRRAAYNAVHSQSGYNAFRETVSAYAENGRFFSETFATGSHSASLQSVIGRRADVAAIDPVTLQLQPQDVRDAIKVIGWTAAAPGLPFITVLTISDSDLVKLRAVLADFFGGAARKDHPEFHFAGFEVLQYEAYDSILAMEQRAIDRSYPRLA
ncbi:PhnD/SsuA/transferrin family substrate-binding protein [Devosia sp.]|uniref:phosphate/phosphite/phosphonate ABC transporter substrate-binding protein n=1 Tax=Devosia sp. TaxID=1871048 RepID=UPI001B1942E5|nr:PhnD/SsuA/transferrin family substrate-binding protein [Devosia sp.]MBO9589732.1 PhnD/SsuA/transferrin family substrate-binding protein [Devosia sp.]